MLERSTVNRNLALMKERGWVTTARTSPTGRAMSVAITGTGVSAFTGASAAWRSAQASAAAMLGPAAASTLDQWLGLYAERRPATSKASATSAKNRRSSAKAAVPPALQARWSDRSRRGAPRRRLTGWSAGQMAGDKAAVHVAMDPLQHVAAAPGPDRRPPRRARAGVGPSGRFRRGVRPHHKAGGYRTGLLDAASLACSWDMCGVLNTPGR